MALISCFSCSSDNDIHLEGMASDGSRILRCGDCGHTWSPPALSAVPASTRTPYEMAKGRFANASMVAPERRTRVARLRTKFLKDTPASEPAVVEHRARHQLLFSPAGLEACSPQDLRDFATSRLAGDAGNTAVFTRAWKRLGEEESAERTKASIEYLLRGPRSLPVEDRLTSLVEDADGIGMPGFKEAQLTKVLSVMDPARYLPILTYGTEGTGKRDVVMDVFGLHLPRVADQTSMTSGRLAVWSNDLLLELAGEGFADAHHAAAFIWSARERVGQTALTSVR
jgi:hypothetical protein